MNRIVFRYADVLLMRAEAEAQLGNTGEAINLVNQIRTRAAGSTQMISNYPSKYGVKFYCEAATVLNAYYAVEKSKCNIYEEAKFTPNKNEYLPIPYQQVSAANGNYKQNCGNW